MPEITLVQSQKIRKRLEHIFAESKICPGLARARCRGLRSLQDQLFMTATVQNLKRLVSFRKRNLKSVLTGAFDQISIFISCSMTVLGGVMKLFNVSSHSFRKKLKILPLFTNIYSVWNNDFITGLLEGLFYPPF